MNIQKNHIIDQNNIKILLNLIMIASQGIYNHQIYLKMILLFRKECIAIFMRVVMNIRNLYILLMRIIMCISNDLRKIKMGLPKLNILLWMILHIMLKIVIIGIYPLHPPSLLSWKISISFISIIISDCSLNVHLLEALLLLIYQYYYWTFYLVSL